tara:strand:- start:1028 stop:1573 length:546 start_codon:yes stop_codon:yes gene_type:complete
MKFFEGDILKKDLKMIEKEIVNSNMFPWYYLPNPVTYKYPCFTHVLLPRYNYESNESVEVNSPSYYFFERLFKNFCKKKKIKVNRILRAALNLQMYFKEEMGTPHSDHDFPHQVCMIYLNTVTRGSTYVFKEKTNVKKHKILKEIKNKAGKIVVFPGENYHAAGHCGKPNERRIICIFSFD